MSGQDKGKGKPSGEHKSAPKDSKDSKVGATSGHTVQSSSKRKLDQVANSSAEELVLLSTQVEELSGDIKVIKDSMTDLIQKSDNMMSKEDMKVFIKGTVEEIMIEIYKTIEMTLESKVKEKTKTLKKDIGQLNKDIETLRNENEKLKKDLTEAQKKKLCN